MRTMAIAFLVPLIPETQQMFDQIDLTGKAQTIIGCDSCEREYVLVHPDTFGHQDIETYRRHIRAHSGNCHTGHIIFLRYPGGLPSTQT